MRENHQYSPQEGRMFHYEAGTARAAVLEALNAGDYSNRPQLVAKVSGTPDAATFDRFFYSALAGRLINLIRSADEVLDRLLAETSDLDDGAFGSLASARRNLKLVIRNRIGLRNLERDVEEYVNSIPASNLAGGDSSPSTVTDSLAALNAQYDRVFDLSRDVVKGITDARLTLSNLLISLVALALSIASVFYERGG